MSKIGNFRILPIISQFQFVSDVKSFRETRVFRTPWATEQFRLQIRVQERNHRENHLSGITERIKRGKLTGQRYPGHKGGSWVAGLGAARVKELYEVLIERYRRKTSDRGLSRVLVKHPGGMVAVRGSPLARAFNERISSITTIGTRKVGSRARATSYTRARLKARCCKMHLLTARSRTPV